ncbi:MAG TPA: hypothetical protein VFF73_22405 [Planctomycetota bacterium]|nr:hypothetical protein [Planctomycetota bacterium]
MRTTRARVQPKDDVATSTSLEAPTTCSTVRTVRRPVIAPRPRP